MSEELLITKVRSEGSFVPKLRILLIEDDSDQRELIRQTLEEHFGSGTVLEVGGAPRLYRLTSPRLI